MQWIVKQQHIVDIPVIFILWLQHALSLKWTSSTRLIIHFCDAPAHGTAYHNLTGENQDNFPKGDPQGVWSIPQAVLTILLAQCVMQGVAPSCSFDLQSCK